jgi:hypothetical protein
MLLLRLLQDYLPVLLLLLLLLLTTCAPLRAAARG